MSTIFMTGGSGFIGRHVLVALAKANHKLYVLVRSKEKLIEAMRGIGWNDFSFITPVQGDLTKPSLGLNPADLQLLHHVDIIIHAGGPMDILLTAEEAQQVFLDGAREITNIAKMIHDSNPLKHFIHVVGFKSPYSEQDHESQRHNDQDSKEPPYEKMKFEADLFIRQALRPWGIPLSVVNPSVVIGDSYTGITEQVGGLGILVDTVRRNLMALVPGGKDYWLPLVHVDHVAAFIAALSAEERPVDHTYYLLDQKSNSPDMIELTRLVSKEVRVNGPFGAIPHRFLKAILNLGAGKLVNMPKESIDFIVNTDFPVSPKLALAEKNNLDLSVSPSTLPFVISDLDYRISHGTIHVPPPFRLNRRANLATIERAGEGTPILILHGTFSTAYNLLPLAEQLSTAGNPIYLIDLPGFGRSPFHHNPSIIEGFEQAIMELILNIPSEVIIVGHSFGGYLAAKVMEKLQDRVQRVLLLQPVLHAIGSNYKSSFLTHTMLRLMSKAALTKQLLHAQGFEHIEEIPADYIPYIHDELKSARVRKTTTEVMSALTQPGHITLNPNSWDYNKVSILWGTKDHKFEIPNPYRDFRITHLPHAHQFPISHPEDTARWISKLINN
ncbi:alpha/beta fold hydrolase [Paenibacillus sp. ACRRX]|uniref:alpha/beta fold hydrolase n=1 Tax=Paenibacillus sp. ACRRX TaxID=2918206 RepID=UPI001EF64923|nr:alpha/beta fold hydrolase [Paenibacillus sp. ACRRX]MCG7408765.1 alpha/beta fold hydrolase [Paenibacillus sp. ACRRX]